MCIVVSEVHYMSEETKNFKCVTGSGGVCDREWGSVWMVVGECVTGSGGVCGREWGECVAGSGGVWQGVGECVTGSGGVCGW